MSTWTCHHCSSLRWTQQLRVAQQVRRHTSRARVSRNDRPQAPEVTASQLLRFAATGTIGVPKSSERNSSHEHTDAYLRQAFDRREIPSIWSFNRPSSRTRTFPEDASNPSTLQELKVSVERIVTNHNSAERLANTTFDLERLLQPYPPQAQYTEQLATLTAIVARCGKWKTYSHDFLVTGMRLAIKIFSVAAMRCYIDAFAAQNYGLTPSVAQILLEDLKVSLELHRWENSVVDVDSMLEMVRGSDGDGPQDPSLYSLIDWSPGSVDFETMSHYVRLLGLMGDRKRLPDMWAKIEATMDGEQSPSLLLVASSCLRAFLDSGNIPAALDGVKRLAGCVDVNEVIPQPLWKDLLESDSSAKLRELASKDRTVSLLDEELLSIEARLGISWPHSGDGNHIRAEDVAIWSDGDLDQIKPSMPRASNGVSSPANTRQLIEEVTRRGFYPKSRTSLSAIADMLNENEGLEIPLGVRRDDKSGLQHSYAWLPMRSPIEVADNPISLRYDASKPPSSSSLGLLRARSCCQSVPLKYGRAFYLIQLGYIAARKEHSAEGAQSSEWESTGHIMAWDRMSKTFQILFVGKGYGDITPGLKRPESDARLPYFHAILDMGSLSMKTPSIFEVCTPIESDGYWIDLDPATNLHT